MNKAINVNDLPEFDIAQHLQTDADVAEYLRQVLEEGDFEGAEKILNSIQFP